MAQAHVTTAQRFYQRSEFTLLVVSLFLAAAVLFNFVKEAEASYCPPGRICPVQPSPPTPVRPVPVPVPPAPVRPAPCPPGTVLDPRLNRCVSAVVNQPMRPVPPRSGDPDEISAANLVNEAMRGLTCNQAGDALRRLANQIRQLAASSQLPPQPNEPELRRRWREHIRSPQFWSKVWHRMADAYSSCNRGCFDDGLAVGEISATAYCAASIALDGLFGIGHLEQPPLPVCETAIHIGCLQGYDRTSAGFQGCSKYTTDSFYGIYNEYKSQDCHL